jgi:hypothetical protein
MLGVIRPDSSIMEIIWYGFGCRSIGLVSIRQWPLLNLKSMTKQDSPQSLGASHRIHGQARLLKLSYEINPIGAKRKADSFIRVGISLDIHDMVPTAERSRRFESKIRG